jgi:hypothetical protein
MINITKHCLDRYAERVLGIEDLQTARQYINSNQDKVSEDINKLFEFATLILTAQINGDKSTKNYWLRDNIVIVTDTGNSTLITLYRIDDSPNEKYGYSKGKRHRGGTYKSFRKIWCSLR